MQATAVLKQLKRMRAESREDVHNLNRAVIALEELMGGSPSRRPAVHLSVTARRAIGKAQKARWAKWRKKNGK